MSVKQGLRLQKLSFGRTLYNKLKKELLLYNPSKVDLEKTQYLFPFVFGILAFLVKLPLLLDNIKKKRKKTYSKLFSSYIEKYKISKLKPSSDYKRMFNRFLVSDLNRYFHLKKKFKLLRIPRSAIHHAIQKKKQQKYNKKTKKYIKKGSKVNFRRKNNVKNKK